MKYAILELETRVGEYETTTTLLTSYKDYENLAEIADGFARDFYDDGEKLDNYDDTCWFFNGGEVRVKATGWKEITREEFDVMYPYLTII